MDYLARIFSRMDTRDMLEAESAPFVLLENVDRLIGTLHSIAEEILVSYLRKYLPVV